MVNLTIGIEEEDLESKSTLGMSDYVRVVGADGVSYKQELDDVSNKVITEYTDIPLAGNNQSVKDAINTLDNQVSNKAEESDLQDVESDLTVLGTRVDQLQSSVGTPLVASTVAGMTNHDKIYVYVGSETGYTNGNWYYWDGTGWVSGGVYNSTAFETDKTLTLSDRAADAKVVGDELTDVKSALSDIIEVLPNIPNFENIAISNDGTTSASDTRLLSAQLFEVTSADNFSIDDDFVFRLIKYTKQGEFVETGVTGWVTSVNFRLYDTNAAYKINVAKADNTQNISPTDIKGKFTTTLNVATIFFDVASASELATVKDSVNELNQKINDNFNLNINQVGNDDMIWSYPWLNPLVTYRERVRKNLYWGFTTSNGQSGVASLDTENNILKKTILKQSDIDDHNPVVPYVDANGSIVCIYSGGHNTDNYIHTRRAETKECIDNFSDDIKVNIGYQTSYAQVFNYDGVIYVFLRYNNTNWGYIYSSDYGATWSALVPVISSSLQLYCKLKQTSQYGLLRMCIYSNPTASDPNIRMGFIDLADGKIYNSDNNTVLGTAGVAVTYNSFNIIIPVSTGTQRLFDVANTAPAVASILYCTFSTDANDDSVYKWYYNGTVYTICNGGESLWHPKYQGGAVFVDLNTIALCRSDSDYDYVELWDLSPNIALNKLIYSELKGTIPIRNARPIADATGKYVLWHRGYYNPNSYTDFNTDAKVYSVTDDEIIY